jgi:acetylglutamate kinase
MPTRSPARSPVRSRPSGSSCSPTCPACWTNLNKLIKQLSPDDARELIADGTISGGMIPKVETCIYALEAGVEGVVILDGKVPHAVLLELLTDHGAGTLMMR